MGSMNRIGPVKRISIAYLLIGIYSLEGMAQVVTFEPSLPTINQALTVFFDATEGSGGLKGYTGDVYAHTGVLTTKSTSTSDWKYVKTGWGQNTPGTKLTRVSQDNYKLEITPDILTYYGIPSSEQVTHVAFVFRSGEKKPGSSEYYEGKDDGDKDIFIEVFEEGLNISILSPAKNSLVVELNDTISVFASASAADSISLFINDQYIGKSDNRDSIVHTIIAGSYGDNRVCVRAYGNGEQVADSFFFYVRKPIVELPLPAILTDGINYTSDTSVTLVLYAPGKESVFVLSDFTGWSATESGAMYRTPDGSRYWLDIGSLKAGKEYPFQYLVDGDLRIADPYADKFLDPWNDKYIDGATYSGLIPYPEGKTVQMVSVLQTAQEPYEWKHAKYTLTEKTKLVIYELLLRDFLAAHDYKTLTDTLDYLDSLGINAIELMPVNEFEGNISWGYNPAFYFAPDKYYGSKNTLKAFIDSCHGRGIAVIQDMVLNHSYGQHSLVRLYFDEQNGRPSADNPWYNVSSPNPVFSWGYDFNHESQATRDFVDRVNAYWLTEYRVDGFRFDFTKGFTNTPGDGGSYDAPRIAILKRMADTIWKINPQAYVILEHFVDNREEKELADHGMLIWGNMNHEYNEATMGYASDLSGTSYKSRGWTNPHLVAYMESHDEERVQFKVKTWGASVPGYDTKTFENRLERMGLSTVFFLSIPGPKMIWQFGELGYSISIDQGGRTDPKPILWDLTKDRRRQRLYQVYQNMIRLRDHYPVFHTDDYRYSLDGFMKRINLNHPEMNVTVIGNFGLTAANIDPDFQSTGNWYEYFTGDILEVSDVNDSIRLQPGEYHLYTDKQLKKPNMITSGRKIELSRNPVPVRIYPNPSPGDVFIEITGQRHSEIKIVIMDIRGRLVRLITTGKLPAVCHTYAWDGNLENGRKAEPGIYFIRIRGEGFSGTAKIIRQ